LAKEGTMRKARRAATIVFLLAAAFSGVATAGPDVPLTLVEEQALKPKDSFKECPGCPVMVVLPAGSFLMGSPTGEVGHNEAEEPHHQVTIARPFAVGKYEVTFAEWDACVSARGCKHNPEEGWGRPSDGDWGRGGQPVINVSWNEITAEYLPWLSRTTGKTYRLLSEAEWEYAARAGTTTPFATGPTITIEQANFNGAEPYGGSSSLYASGENVSRYKTVEVGSYSPNAFGLYDMHGNAWEWVQDCWNSNYNGAPVDGSAWAVGECDKRIPRGGSWQLNAKLLRSAQRAWLLPNFRSSNNGFRVAKSL
jgi:formylglycine-generating enzyme required for sulfatase activity